MPSGRGIDPCGECGKYHTPVTDGPLFQHPLAVRTGARVTGGPLDQRFHQIDVQLAPEDDEQG